MAYLHPTSPAGSKLKSPSVATERSRSPSHDGLQIAALLHALQTPACYFTRGGEVLGINDAWRAYTGWRVETSGPLQWIELIHPEHRYDALSKLCATHAHSDHESLKCRLAGPRGTSRWFIVNLHSVDAGWLCTCTDIHDLKEKESELASRATMQSDMLNVSVDCIKLITPHGNLLHMNRAGCRALGVDENSGFGMPWLPLLPADVQSDGNAALACARNGAFSRFPGRSVIAGKGTQYWDNMLTPILDADGKTTAILCVSREVTRERAADDLIRRNEERLAIATRAGGLGIWDYDIAADALQCDESWYRIMGGNSGNPSGPINSIGEFLRLVHPDDIDKATEVTRGEKEGNAGVEYRIVDSSGEIRWIKSTAYLQYENGIARRTVGFVLDITESRVAELRREEWLHFISHDMRSPQSSILALIDLQMAAEQSMPTPDLLGRIAGYARRTLALADDFVQLARAETPVWSLAEAHLGGVVHDAADEMWALARARNIVLDVNIGDDVRVARVEPFLLMRAVANLLSNAVKFSPRGATVTVRLYDVEHGYAIAVSDHGPGIPAEAQHELFEPFRRLRSDLPHCPSGAGLGLVFVKTVAQRHGGSIELYSRPGEGSTFILTLPGTAPPDLAA
ncbi:hypothetical protein BTH42_12045 [Burkholderia sp. SRS-W-2-2016]|uniref:PAS domain-containing sensor histidine kinase n=1 Tax=Burkholderia sp. SRS-W-2-2016 TaxID=1926878 RepID=UPI00094AA756|nr:PAS domain-containing sensor histidine kinase [Burkholderia sp. SRS-W-2-2016]OLL31651.1 hypothetical protein BTH42_12045 [Burkholderia sp. SRS-W-2-2016]